MSPCLFFLLYGFCHPAEVVIPSATAAQAQEQLCRCRGDCWDEVTLSLMFSATGSCFSVTSDLSHGSQKVLLVEATFEGFGKTYQMFCIRYKKDRKIQTKLTEQHSTSPRDNCSFTSVTGPCEGGSIFSFWGRMPKQSGRERGCQNWDKHTYLSVFKCNPL